MVTPDITDYAAIILDTETTDNKPETAHPIELGWASFSFVEAAPVLTHTSRYKPKEPPKFGAIATHHILMSDLENCQSSDTINLSIPPVQYWIGHNIDFDWTVLGKPPVKRICTLALARSLWPECDSHSLSALAYYCLGATEETRARVKSAHNALADVLLCADILRVMLQVIRVDTLEELWKESEDARIPTIMTFGKFKGEPISAVDRGYANWYRRQTDTDPYVIEAFRRAGLI